MIKTAKLDNKYTIKIILFSILMIVGLTACKQAVPTQQTKVNTTQDIKVHFIDTGNSDAILLQNGESGALIDGGDNDDETLVTKYIQEQGIKTLEMVFATHPDADHIGGLDAVLEQIPVKQLYVGNGSAKSKTYTDFIQAAIDKNLSPSVPLLNSKIPFGEGIFQVVSVANEEDVNNNSIVLLYTYGENTLLFMGDAGKEIEKTLQQVKKVDLIKIGHHGSSTSSDRAFLTRIKPSYAIITSGKGNRYGHPHKETMETLKELNIPVYRNDESGDIIFTINGKELSTSQSPGSYVPGNTEQLKTNVSKNVSKNDKEEKEWVYYTKNGTKYHKDKHCSNMKNPIKVDRKEVGNRTACEKCIK